MAIESELICLPRLLPAKSVLNGKSAEPGQ